MKKIAIFILTLAVLLSCVISVPAASASAISVGKVEGIAGDKVIVPIMIDKNSGFVSLTLKITYDTSVLTLTSVDDTGALEGEYHSVKYNSPYQLNWINDTATSNTMKTGKIVELIFNIADDAKTGRYDIQVSMDAYDALDAEGNNVPFALTDGCITIVEPEHECSFGNWEPYTARKHVRYCDNCDEKELENHNFDEGEITQEPTCEDEGEIKYTCEDCGYSKTDWIEPKEHTFGDWVKQDEEQHVRTCDCGETETESHKWSAPWGEPGQQISVCDVCGAQKAYHPFPKPIPVTGIQLDKERIDMSLGITVYLSPIITPGTATNQNVIWESSDPDVASVSNDGGVTSKKAGTATITARTEDGNFEAKCEITVKPSHVPGDINGDGKTNNKDLSVLFQYLSGWDVEVVESALDVNGDGKKNNKDLTLLFQYLSNWDVTIH